MNPKKIITEGAFLVTLAYTTLNHEDGHCDPPIELQSPVQHSGIGHSSYNISVTQTATGSTMPGFAILATKP